MPNDQERSSARDLLTGERPSIRAMDTLGIAALEARQSEIVAEARALRADVAILRRQLAEMASTIERLQRERQRELRWTEQLERDLLAAIEDARARDSVLFSALRDHQAHRRLWWRRPRKRRVCT